MVVRDFSFITVNVDFDGREKEDLTEFDSPYKLGLFLLLAEVENVQQIGDGFDVDAHAFLGILITFLIRQRHLSIFSLKSFILRFIEPISPSLSDNFFRLVRIYGQSGVIPNLEAGVVQKRNATFVWPKSVIGMFMRKVQEVYDKRDLLGEDHFGEYLRAEPTPDEIRRMTDVWHFDVNAMAKRIAEIEEKFMDVVC